MAPLVVNSAPPVKQSLRGKAGFGDQRRAGSLVETLDARVAVTAGSEAEDAGNFLLLHHSEMDGVTRSEVWVTHCQDKIGYGQNDADLHIASSWATLGPPPDRLDWDTSGENK